ncbi:MAG: hypothetical protein EXS25_02295 [Pedosphaera sp.]|nr:hypothetical protein [Pedosphaera sp.]
MFDPLTQELKGAHSVEASAGTGKTYSITLLWLRLLVENELSVDQILVGTFTKAATAELRERLLRSLRRALEAARSIASNGPPNDSVETRILLQATDNQPDRAVAQVERLTRALSGFDLAPISTLHGFCQSLISRHALELGCDPSLTLVENCDEILGEITGDTLMELSDTIKPDIISLQRVARALQERPTARLLSMEETSTELDKKLKKLKEKIAAIGPALTLQIANKATKDAVNLKLKNLIETGKWIDLTDPQKKILPATFTELWAQFGAVSRQRQHLPENTLALRIQTCLPERKNQSGVRSFDDILITVQKALAAQTSDGRLATAVRRRLRAAIIDECQDSDTVQIEVFQRLFIHPSTVSFLVIGDPKQSIYRFRGADLASYQRLAYATQSTPQLTVNHRSDGPLVDVLNQLYGPNFLFPDSLVHCKSIAYIPVTAQEPLQRIFDPKNTSSVLLHWSGESDREFAKLRIATWVAEEIARLLRDDVSIEDRHSREPRRITYSDIAVLASGHKDLRLIRRQLTHLGIPCQSSGSGLGSVFDSNEARDLVCWLEVLSALKQKGDLLSKLSAFLGTPLGAMSAPEILLFQANLGKQASLCDQFQKTLLEFNRAGPLTPLLRQLTLETISKLNLSYAEGERRFTNWRQLGTLLQSQFERGLKSPESLVAWLTAQIALLPESIDDEESESTLMRLETDSAAVQLTTIHGSKGLEYPVVFCPFLWDVRSRKHRSSARLAVARVADDWIIDVGSLNFEKNLTTAFLQEDEEEHRKLYVALTRARHRLYLGIAPVEESKGGHKNSASVSALVSLPGLGLTQKPRDLWKESLRTLQNLYFLDTELPEASLPDDSTTFLASKFSVANSPEIRNLTPPQAHIYSPFPLFAQRSFSSLTKSNIDYELHAADRDQPDKPDLSPPPVLISPHIADRPESPDLLEDLGTPGSLLGDQLHRVLEDYLGNGKSLEIAVAECETPESWLKAVESLLSTPLLLPDASPLQLKDLPGRCITEMQFHLPVGLLTSKSLSAALALDPRLKLWQQGSHWIKAIDDWPFADFTGFLHGFIDLIFEHEGRWYVADYKSNRLPNYSNDSLDGAMLRHHYFLQARFYTIALHRHLTATLTGYSYNQHFGGVVYLFVRGFPNHGLWFDRPSLKTLAPLDALFTSPFSPL